MKKLILTAVLLANVSAHADIIKCDFTEPFLATTYSMTQQTLTYDTSFLTGNKGSTKVFKNVSFQIKGAGKFELVAKDGTVLQKLDLSFNGSNGMSDGVYPYEVKDESDVFGGANGGVGGCVSNYLKVTGEN
ncbi:MAG: hypothetical protein H7328_13260 [Bdellovibrio sp.]|nr:hypothetical protein [Bdellovibrio sp.]